MKVRRFVGVMLGLGALCLASIVFIGQEVLADVQPIFAAPEEFPPLLEPDPGELWVVRAYYRDRPMLDTLTTWREPWEVHSGACPKHVPLPCAGYGVLGVDRADYARLQTLGFYLEVDWALSQSLEHAVMMSPDQVTSIPSYSCYRTVEETYAAAVGLAARYATLATWMDIGDTWEKQNSGAELGYDLQVLRLTNQAIPGPKPILFVGSSVHGREYTPAELNTRFAEYLLIHYDVDADVTWLLDYHEIHLLLHANPDGRKKAEQGLWWRKNTNANYCVDTSDKLGADINRNYAFQWNCCGGSSDDSCDDLYHGPYAASEPETQAMQAYLRATFPDQRGEDLAAAAPVSATGLYLDIHSYGQLVLWPWGFAETLPPNHEALQTLGHKFAYYNDYDPMQAYDLYRSDGTSTDFVYGELGVASYVFELGNHFFQGCETFENEILPQNLPALLYAAKVARAPYLLPSGPDVLRVRVSPAGVFPGEQITLSALLDDGRYPDSTSGDEAQPIVAAEFYVDVPPWVTTTIPLAHPMVALDGAFDTEVETALATLDVRDFSLGKHSLFVRAKDAAGQWGPVSAVFLYVLDPASTPSIEGYVRDAGMNLPLAATVQAGPFTAQADRDTGYYQMYVVSGTYTLLASASGYATETLSAFVVQDRQTLQQDFYLYPTCDIFTDDVESGNLGWTVKGSWAVTTETYHSADHAWVDSPGKPYPSGANISLTSQAFDLSEYAGIKLSFWHGYDIEDSFDYGYVEYSTDAGETWQQAASYTGQSASSWVQQNLALPALDHEASVRLRFRLESDDTNGGDGWHIDDIYLSGEGPGCLSNSCQDVQILDVHTDEGTLYLGQSTRAHAVVIGSLPLTYTWDFGGAGTGEGLDTASPSFTYAEDGQYTIALTVTNACPSQSTATLPIYIMAFSQKLYLPLLVKG